MYLATQKQAGRTVHLLRESFSDNGRFFYRELFDLGESPADYIVYPGGNSFYFDGDLIQALSGQGVKDPDRELEVILFSFLEPHVQRIVSQMTRLGPRRKRYLSAEAMAKAQARLHPFDRRRLYFLRFGRMDSDRMIMRPHKFLNVLAEMSRDEMEFFFQGHERKLRTREIKQYVFLALNLAAGFSGNLSKMFPAALDPSRLDEVFLEAICRINSDPAYLGREADGYGLSPYLRRYAVIWFDFDFGQRPPSHQIHEEYLRGRARMKPPPPQPGLELSRALKAFGLTPDQWRQATRVELLRTYRRLAMEHHPDQGGDQDAFIELNLAYERLLQDK